MTGTTPVRNAPSAQWAAGRAGPTRGGAMASPLTDRRPVAPGALDGAAGPLPAGLAPTSPLPADVRDAVAAIAAAPGAWCPALSPDGTRVAYVTDRSGLPRLEVAALDHASQPAVLSGPHHEVV